MGRFFQETELKNKMAFKVSGKLCFKSYKNLENLANPGFGTFFILVQNFNNCPFIYGAHDL
jgi:hypothetical protein